MSKVANNIFMADNMMGYRWGLLMWLAFAVPSVGVMFDEPNVDGPSRDFLVTANLFSCLTLGYFNFFFWSGVPASTPSMHAITSEAAARLLLVSYYGMDEVTGGSGSIATWNTIQVYAGFIFGVVKLAQSVWVLWNRREYMAYEEEQKSKMI